MSPSWIHAVADGVELDVWVVPGASRTAVVGEHGGALRIRVASPPEGGKANKALLAHLATSTGAKAELLRGHASRRKRVLLAGADRAMVLKALDPSGPA